MKNGQKVTFEYREELSHEELAAVVKAYPAIAYNFDYAIILDDRDKQASRRDIGPAPYEVLRGECSLWLAVEFPQGPCFVGFAY